MPTKSRRPENEKTEPAEELTSAGHARAAFEAEQLVESTAGERRIAGLRRQLVEGAPEELQMLRENIAALVDDARTKADTRVVRGFENIEGRRADLVSTNTDSIADLISEARRIDEALAAERLAEVPDLERFGPFAEVTSARVAEAVIVPAGLAERFAAIGGVSTPRPEMSPAQAREVLWAAERSAKRRWDSGEAWR